ncbi:hypothetical protein COCVIDRAFT_23480 [Bipolaris victoriae FI3]|uniref:Uncharacterized protein n=1 Tax=Bipolaris victoriae (strain FI3) TaxID=930091 RepID=W7EXV1_BIPV3|nr:hypothetical protein COCVIDRAFT_23480 [Bipolaris victoriae FI3]
MQPYMLVNCLLAAYFILLAFQIEHARTQCALLRVLAGGGFELTSFGDDLAPPYAILSHAWTDGQEVTYNELLAGIGANKRGYAKICFCGERAAADGLDYF